MANITDDFGRTSVQPSSHSQTNKKRKRIPYSVLHYCNKLARSANYDGTKRVGQYLYVATNDFYFFQVINLIDQPGTQGKLYEQGEIIATAELSDNSELIYLEVHPEFRRQKIGFNLIKFIAERCPQFIVYGGQEYNSRYRLTYEGKRLIDFCYKKHVLSDEQYLQTDCPPSPYCS